MALTFKRISLHWNLLLGIDCAEALLLKHESSESNATLPSDELRFLHDRWPAVARQTRSEMRPFVDAAYLTAGLHRTD
jgi:hypothetical protein